MSSLWYPPGTSAAEGIVAPTPVCDPSLPASKRNDPLSFEHSFSSDIFNLMGLLPDDTAKISKTQGECVRAGLVSSNVQHLLLTKNLNLRHALESYSDNGF